MTCLTLMTSTAYWRTERQLRSVWTTTLATLRWTKSSPGSMQTIWLAGTRLSEQPIQKNCGACWADRSEKKFGSYRRIFSDQARLRVRRSLSDRIGILLWRQVFNLPMDHSD